MTSSTVELIEGVPFDGEAVSGVPLLTAPVSFPLHRQPGQESPIGCCPHPGGMSGLGGHMAAVGERPTTRGRAGEELLEAMAEVGLTGRGGAHFPAAAKWQAVLDAVRATGRPATVVANAAEGEPASAKDAALLLVRPHLVLDGLVCAAEALGADRLVVWMHEGDHEGHRALRTALAERRTAGWGEPPVILVSGPQRYLSGESSAIVRGLSGGPVLPAFRRFPSAISGVLGAPTLVQNVETLARVGLVARTGPQGYRPSALLTVVAGGRRTVLEASPRLLLRDAVRRGGWDDASEPRAVLVGGYGGTWLPWDVAAPLQVTEAGLRGAGASLGAGVVAPLPPASCGIRETAAVVDYLAASSARQCGPCMFGLPSMAKVIRALAVGAAAKGDVRRLERFAVEVSGRGACHHPDGVVRLVASALETFAADVRDHLGRHPCPSTDPGLPVPVTA